MSDQQTVARYMIQMVAKRAGLKPDLIRAWERRYQAVTPVRSEGGRRLYSDLDIARLCLLSQATDVGHSIGQIARLPIEELENLLRAGGSGKTAARSAARISGNADDVIEKCLAVILDFDAGALEANLHAAITDLGILGCIENLIVPLMRRIGDNWQAGTLRPVHEHLASAVVRATMYELRGHHSHPSDTPSIVFATPIHQLHELGILFAAVLAENDGWRSVYLGTSLPAEEIAAAAKFTAARAVVMGIGQTGEAVSLRKECRRLKTLIGNRTELLVGGQSAPAYDALWQETGARRLQTFTELRQVLAELRRDIALNTGIFE